MNKQGSTPAEAFGLGLSRYLSALAERQGSPPDAIAALQTVLPPLASYLADGHVCAPLSALAGSSDPGRLDTLRRQLRLSTLVAAAGDSKPLPLVLDAADHLYLYRHYDYERRLACACLRRLQHRPLLADPARLRAQLDTLFAANAARLGARPDWQKIAAALALRNNFTVISGGPGTGKTSTVVNILACLLTDNPDLRIALTAPTGKAAARMKEALQERAAALPDHLRARLPQEASTLHMLLGVIEGSRQFHHHAGHPVAYDVVVVDEASMLDLALATHLIEAIPDNARLILLGDKDQLAAVEAGSVFAELSASPTLSAPCQQDLAQLTGLPASALQTLPARTTSPLSDAAVWFQENFRFAKQPGIGHLARLVNEMRSTEAIDWLLHAPHPDVAFSEQAAGELPEAVVQHLLQGFSRFLDAVRQAQAPDAVHAAFGDFRVLCALRQTARGVVRLNQLLSKRFRQQLASGQDQTPASEWYPGRPVMVLENNYVLKVFNGDIGIALPTGEGKGALGVYFPTMSGECRAIDPVRLPPHETAFAMTVHKSQGSEFGAIAFVLPGEMARVLTRELIYTGITRAKKKVELFGSTHVLEAAIRRPTERLSGLTRHFAFSGQCRQHASSHPNTETPTRN